MRDRAAIRATCCWPTRAWASSASERARSRAVRSVSPRAKAFSASWSVSVSRARRSCACFHWRSVVSRWRRARAASSASVRSTWSISAWACASSANAADWAWRTSGSDDSGMVSLTPRVFAYGCPAAPRSRTMRKASSGDARRVVSADRTRACAWARVADAAARRGCSWPGASRTAGGSGSSCWGAAVPVSA